MEEERGGRGGEGGGEAGEEKRKTDTKIVNVREIRREPDSRRQAQSMEKENELINE